MTERDFARYFVDFLIAERGFPKGSILVEASIGDTQDKRKRYIADLILLDTDFNNYLALVEFKRRGISATSEALFQVKAYIDVLDMPTLPAYLVIPKNEDDDQIDFRIYLLDDNDWREIEKSDFPHYETLRSKNKADEKKEFKDISEAKNKELKKKKELIRDTAYSTLASLIAGIIAVILISRTIIPQSGPIASSSASKCCDSLEKTQQQIFLKIAVLENTLAQIRSNDSIKNIDREKIQLVNIDNRVRELENVFNKSPERLLKMQELTFQIQELKDQIKSEKELRDINVINLKERIDQLSIWTSGLIITIIGSIIGFAVNAFRKS